MHVTHADADVCSSMQCGYKRSCTPESMYQGSAARLSGAVQTAVSTLQLPSKQQRFAHQTEWCSADSGQHLAAACQQAAGLLSRLHACLEQCGEEKTAAA